MEEIKDIVKREPKSKTYKNTKEKILPKLKAPLDIENEDKWWTASKTREQMKIYFTTLKWKKSNGKPVWWPTSLSFEKFEHYSYATMRQNKLDQHQKKVRGKLRAAINVQPTSVARSKANGAKRTGRKVTCRGRPHKNKQANLILDDDTIVPSQDKLKKSQAQF